MDVPEDDSAAGAAFDNVEYLNGAEGRSMGLIIPEESARKLVLKPLSLQKIFVENIMTGPASLIRKSVVDRIGGYDTNTSLNSDLHWFYRAAAYFSVRFVNYIGVKKRIHPLNTTAMTPHYERGVVELEDIRTNYADVYQRIGRGVFNKKLGRKYFRLAQHYERHEEIGKAREMYKKAMLLRKFSFRYHWEYLRSSLFQ